MSAAGRGSAGPPSGSPAARAVPAASPLAAVALAALAAAHALVRTSAWGASIEADSHLYLGVAENILGGEGVKTADGASSCTGLGGG